MAPDPVHVDEGLDVVLLDQPLVAPVGVLDRRVVVLLPGDRLVGDLQGLEHLVVEPVAAHQALGHVGQEEPGLGALDDPVVVGGGDGHRLAHARARPALRGSAASNPAGTPSAPTPTMSALAGHEPGHRLDGADRARVGEGHRRAGEVVRGDLVGVDLADQVLVGRHEALEVAGVGLGDARHEQRAAASTSRRRRPGRGRTWSCRMTPGVPLPSASATKAAFMAGTATEPLDHRVADEMGEADLAARGALQLVVDDGAVDLEQLGRHHPHTGGRGHPERRLHVDHDAAGGARAAGRLAPLGAAGRAGRGDRTAVGPRWRTGPGRSGAGGRLGRPRPAPSGDERRSGRPVVGEELLPGVDTEVGSAR